MDALRPRPIPALSDNYVWLLADAAGDAIVVDPGEAAPVRAVLEREGLRLRAILVTHHHPDHTAGIAALCEGGDVDVIAPDDARITTATRRIGDGNHVVIDAPALGFDVIAVPGHTTSHVAFFGHGLLFCGDTLFSAGCGRMFEGTPARMLASLERLAALPGDTLVCCGHEYTVANTRFALEVDPANAALRARHDEAVATRARGLPTLPSTLAGERACNPFLRTDAPALVKTLAIAGDDHEARVARFAALRARKDAWRDPNR